MAKRDVIVMGASAGGVEAYCEILRGLPADLAASVFIVQHIGRRSVLADVLGRCAALQLAIAADGEAVKHGRAYVAPAGQHLFLQRGRVRVSSRLARASPAVGGRVVSQRGEGLPFAGDSSGSEREPV